MAGRNGKRTNGAGSVYKNPNGTWTAQVLVGTSADGKNTYKRLKRKTKLEAERALRDLQARYAGGVIDEPNLTVGRLLDDWLIAKTAQVETGSLRPRSLRGYSDDAAKHIKPVLGTRLVAKLRATEVEAVFQRIAKDPPSAAHHAYRTLRTAFRWAHKRGLIVEDPTARTEFRLPKPKEQDFYSREEVETIAKALKAEPSHVRALLLTFAATGCRYGEVAGLTWDRIDLDTGQVVIDRQIQVLGGKASLAPTKTGKSKRKCELPEQVLEAIREEKARQVMEGGHPLGLVFTTHTGAVWHNKNVNEAIRAVCRSAGVRYLSAHKFRHTYTTLLIALGVPLHEVSRLLGHSSIRLTADLYGHHVEGSAKKASDLMGQMMFGDD